MPERLIQQIDNLLPQTQCTQCGFEGCLPYAKAIASNQADLNRCPPGGKKTTDALAALLNKPSKPIDPDCGQTIERHIASINPQHCIGCTLCINACPVDAIIGSNKRRHAVLAHLCTGCELCIPPCPVDCIDMVFIAQFSDWNQEQAHAARQRMQKRNMRLLGQKEQQAASLQAKSIHKSDEPNISSASGSEEKHATVQAALVRARAKRQVKNS